MTHTVAATSINMPDNSIFRLALIALIGVALYAAWCWIKPFTHCPRCAGKGISPKRLRDRWRYRGRPPAPRAARGAPQCPRCRGTGLRLRLGRRIANFLIRRYRRAR
ncbi:hypothetical protein [Actinoplanes sp. NPDC026619]|uniref:hypothetical protein n=1 Tax=Actinoplanes sp. NPDC026619 TaxID=3155798 RepID=UPI0033E4A2B6